MAQIVNTAVMPEHYQTENGKQLIDNMLEIYGKDDTLAFCLLNAQKYIARCKRKHADPVEDIDKAIRYLELYKVIHTKL